MRWRLQLDMARLDFRDRTIPLEKEDCFEDDMPWHSCYGGWLKTDKVNAARNVDLDFASSRAECLQCTSAKPMGLLWIDTNKGDDVKGNY